MIGYFLLLTASWNLLAGFTGQFSFAHAALATAGAYASIAFTDIWNVPVLATLPLAGIATGLAGALLGFLCLRVRGVYLSLATFAFSGAFLVWAAAADEITGGTRGHTSQIFFLGASLQPYAWLALGLVTAYFVTQALLLDTGMGTPRGSHPRSRGDRIRPRCSDRAHEGPGVRLRCVLGWRRGQSAGGLRERGRPLDRCVREHGHHRRHGRRRRPRPSLRTDRRNGAAAVHRSQRRALRCGVHAAGLQCRGAPRDGRSEGRAPSARRGDRQTRLAKPATQHDALRRAKPKEEGVAAK